MYSEIYLDAPNVGKEEKAYLNKAIDDNFVSAVGPYVPLFENKFAEYLKIKKAVSTQSGTAALHIALYELGIGAGDEVIVPALTFVATVNPVLYVGAKPVFVDVSPNTWNIESADIEKKITKKTKAIIAVHLYGNPCNMTGIMKLAKKYNLSVIEDATESLGAKYKNRFTGTFGDLGCFSFNGNKLITTGGGGMVVGNKVKRLKHIKSLVNQAKEESMEEAYFPEVGFNYRMTNISAALGLAQMEKLDIFLEKKRRISGIYKEELAKIKGIYFQEEYSGAVSSWWFICIKLEIGVAVETLREKLMKKKIPARRIFMPLLNFPHYKRCKKGNYENSYEIYKRGLSLPSCTLNAENDIRYVCRMIKESL